ncbi:MAG: GNAT family N-acetyltransferase [Calditrichaeota bacterium]|nr:MAG: GNAT family N-acetyltransferase [Calditrichota bacterium]
MPDPKLEIRAATGHECAEVALLLKTSGLPIHDIDVTLEGFLLAYEGARLVGTVGVESYGEVGLLRSLAVTEEYRNRGVGARLVEAAVASAREQGIRTLYLLTTTAKGYFARHGFRSVSREEVPETIKRTGQFGGICPASAEVLYRDL